MNRLEGNYLIHQTIWLLKLAKADGVGPPLQGFKNLHATITLYRQNLLATPHNGHHALHIVVSTRLIFWL